MNELKATPEVMRILNYDRQYHPHPVVRRRMTAVWMLLQGESQAQCARFAGVSERTVRRYSVMFQKGCLYELGVTRWKGRRSRLQAHRSTLVTEFNEHPPYTVAEAGERIEKLCGVRLAPTQVRYFLHSQKFEWRKVGAMPVPPKVPIEEHVARQADFVATKLEPVLAEARAGKGHVFFVDAAHFVLGMFLCCLWSQTRLFIRSSSGRQRFNVLGAWDAVTHQFVSICNITVVNQDTFCELLIKISKLGLIGPITLILDNAKYQHCVKCIAQAKDLGITLLFLPAYSPNLNLIERIWKFVKKECLYGKHFSSFANFRSRIENCIDEFDTTHRSKLNSLMTHNFQTFENRSILVA
jgi:transposase